ncbi:hypothetical protein Sste5344_000654 [Sporothrix stenoceras]
MAMLKKSRDVGEHEQVKKSLELLDKRREEQMRALSKKTDFPSLPELHRPKSEAEIKRHKVAEDNVAKSTSDLVSSTKNLLSHVFAWKQPVSVLESDVQSLKAKQDNMYEKLKGPSLKTLEEDNARLREQVRDLAGLVENLSKRVPSMDEKVDSASSASTKLASVVEQLSTRSKIHSSMIEGIESKVTDLGTSIAKLEAVDLEAINDYMSKEKQHQLEKQKKQEVEIAKLKTQMLAVQNGLKSSTSAPTAERQPQGQQPEVQNAGTTSTSTPVPVSMPAPAPAAAVPNQGTPPVTTPATATPLVFPGDDFASLRIEISMLNERIAPLEKLPGQIEELRTRHTKANAAQGMEINKLRDEMRTNFYKGFDTMANKFGNLIDTESKERSERLVELEEAIQKLKDQAAKSAQSAQSDPTAANTQTQSAPPAANTDTAMAEATLEPFLSPVPEPVQPAEPVGPIEPLSALPARTQLAGGFTVQELEKEMRLLQERMQYSEDELRSVRVEFNGQCATLTMIVSTLDSQFNNLTTKDLYHSIIGHLEKLYPNPRQMQEDVKRMGADIHHLKKANENTNESVRKMKEIVRVHAGHKRSLTSGGSNGGPPGESPSLAKRLKIGGPTPGGNASINGTANNSANSSTNGSVNGASAATANAS